MLFQTIEKTLRDRDTHAERQPIFSSYYSTWIVVEQALLAAISPWSQTAVWEQGAKPGCRPRLLQRLVRRRPSTASGDVGFHGILGVFEAQASLFPVKFDGRDLPGRIVGQGLDLF